MSVTTTINARVLLIGAMLLVGVFMKDFWINSSEKEIRDSYKADSQFKSAFEKLVKANAGCNFKLVQVQKTDDDEAKPMKLRQTYTIDGQCATADTKKKCFVVVARKVESETYEEEPSTCT